MNIIPSTLLAAGLGVAAAAGHAQTSGAVLDTKPAFMQIVTNYTFKTNLVIVTNYVVVTNAVVATNYYNAQGQLLMPVAPDKPPLPGLIPIAETKPETKPATPAAPAAPDPAKIKATQLQAVRDLLAQSLLATSNKVSVAGSFTSNATYRIQIPQGVTSLDRKKTQNLLTAMNLTAEKAAPDAVTMLLKMAAQVTTDDPAAVIAGGTDAATRLLLTANGDAIQNQVLAAVQRAGVEPRLREAYNDVMLKGGGLLGSVLGTGPSVDIHSHVTEGTLRALLNILAEQEAAIRSDPAARKTPALQEAFKK